MAPSVAPKAHRALHRICSAKEALQYLISGEYHGIGANCLSVSKEVMWVCVCVWVCGCVHVLAHVMHWTWWHAGMLSCILFYFPLLQWLEVIIDAFCTNAKELMRCFWTRPCLDVSSVAMSDSSWQRPQTWRRTSSLGSRNVCVSAVSVFRLICDLIWSLNMFLICGKHTACSRQSQRQETERTGGKAWHMIDYPADLANLALTRPSNRSWCSLTALPAMQPKAAKARKRSQKHPTISKYWLEFFWRSVPQYGQEERQLWNALNMFER